MAFSASSRSQSSVFDRGVDRGAVALESVSESELDEFLAEVETFCDTVLIPALPALLLDSSPIPDGVARMLLSAMRGRPAIAVMLVAHGLVDSVVKMLQPGACDLLSFLERGFQYIYIYIYMNRKRWTLTDNLSSGKTLCYFQRAFLFVLVWLAII